VSIYLPETRRGVDGPPQMQSERLNVRLRSARAMAEIFANAVLMWPVCGLQNIRKSALAGPR